MRCQNCKRELGEGLLPARCPHCGQSPLKANPKDETAARKNLDDIVRHTRIAQMKRETPQHVARTSRTAKNTAETSKKRAKMMILGFGGVVGVVLVIALISFIGFGPHVPDVVGWQEDRAKTTLEQTGYNVERTEEFSQTIDANHVVSTDPSALAFCPKGSSVKMSVAKARIMPDVIGMAKDEATAALDTQSIPYTLKEEPSDKPEGTVVSSSLEAGSTVEANTSAVLTVAIPLRIPHVVGLTQTEAEAALRDLNLNVVIQYKHSDDLEEQGKVLSSDPVEGTVVASNSNVTLVVASSTQGAAQETAEAVINAVYGQTPVGDSIGSALLPFLSASCPYASASPHDVWWGLVKRGGLYGNENPALQALPRSIVSKNIEVSADGKSATASVVVRWDWTPMGAKYAGVTSQDTHNIQMTFDDQGKLVSFNDPATDIPAFTYG